MLNFRNTNIIFILLLIVLIVVQYDQGFDVSWFIALLLFYTAVLFYGSFYIRSNFFVKTFFKGDPAKKQIALSFDDGPSTTYTPEILNVLKEQSVKATFFTIGENIEEHPDIFKQILEEGHLVGNHSFYHSNWFDLQTSKSMIEEMQETHELVYQLSGKHLNWFRPPYGVINPQVKKALRKMKYQPIGWSVRSMDTVARDRAKLLNRLKQSLRPGAVILFHDTQQVTLEVLPDYIQFVKEQGYEIVHLDKLLHLQAYRSDSPSAQKT